jgi:NADH dehydrogenase [ubiquinone] 1 alpha subcomplex assembly factor 2
VKSLHSPPDKANTNPHPGLTFTRTLPPSLDELSTDHARRQALNPRILAIEERERTERIRQGYLLEDGEQQVVSTPRITEPSFTPAPSISAQTSPSSSPTSTSDRIKSPYDYPQTSASSSAATSSPTTDPSSPYTVPTPTSPNVSPPKETVDPTRHSSPEELRRLSEEDTRRRMKESGVGAEGLATAGPAGGKQAGVEGVGLGGSLKPRRRGAG